MRGGKLSRMRHDARGSFEGIPQDFVSSRYHLLTAAMEDSGVIMGVRHHKYTL